MSVPRWNVPGLRGRAEPVPRVDRRRDQRVVAVISATVRPATLGDGAILHARAVNLCDLGMHLQLPRRMPVGTEVLVDLECELPLRVHLGYDADSLVVDGPMHTHIVRVAGVVRRAERRTSHSWDIGIEICPRSTRFDELQVVRSYVDHLRSESDGLEY